MVMATAMAPIIGGESLVYGSADAGNHVEDGSGELRAARVVQQLADSWHLAAHPVSDGQRSIHSLPLATDIELHLPL